MNQFAAPRLLRENHGAENPAGPEHTREHNVDQLGIAGHHETQRGAAGSPTGHPDQEKARNRIAGGSPTSPKNARRGIRRVASFLGRALGHGYGEMDREDFVSASIVPPSRHAINRLRGSRRVGSL